MNAFDLSGKTFLVTGASSGLGRQTAFSIAQYGGNVVITGRNKVRLNETFEKLMQGIQYPQSNIQIQADLTSQDDINTLVGQLPVLNGVVYSVGFSDLIPAKFINPEDLDRNFKVNFDASVLLTSALLRKKKLHHGSCSLVFISTISTRYPFVGGALYISAKAALEAYARVLGLELLSKKIRVNCISPGFVKGTMLDDTRNKISEETFAKIKERQPLGLGDPEDVANTIVFYLSPASEWITGTSLILGGG